MKGKYQQSGEGVREKEQGSFSNKLESSNKLEFKEGGDEKCA